MEGRQVENGRERTEQVTRSGSVRVRPMWDIQMVNESVNLQHYIGAYGRNFQGEKIHLPTKTMYVGVAACVPGIRLELPGMAQRQRHSLWPKEFESPQSHSRS